MCKHVIESRKKEETMALNNGSIHDLLGREVKIGDKEGEITNILGTQHYEVTFFDLNEGKTSIHYKDISKYLVPALEENTLIPSMERIRALYDEVIPLMLELKTKEDVINFGKKHKTTMEINYDVADKFDESQVIEVIRCEVWGDLDYIYVYSDGSAPLFDVWCDFMEYDFIDGTTIDKLEKDYVEGIKWLWSRCETQPEDLKEIISALRQHGVEYNDMIEIYGFESEIVEEYEADHYELGYGDVKETNKLNNLIHNATKTKELSHKEVLKGIDRETGR